jgi:hypothetical protein
MAKFQIATPGGFEVEVQADTEEQAIAEAQKSWQTLPRIIHKADGGVRIFERSNGQRYLVAPGYSTTDSSRIDAVMSGKGVKADAQSENDQQRLKGNVLARVNEFARGMPFVGSYIDEAAGAVFGTGARDEMRRDTAAMQREKPGQTMALNIGGGVAGTAGAIAAAPASVARAGGALIGQGSRASQVLRGAGAGILSGGTEGAIYGFGEGTEGNRTNEAGNQAALGATFGGVLGGASPLVGEVVQNLVKSFKRSDVSQISRAFGVSPDAAKVMKSAFDRGGDIQDAIAAIRRAGDDGMIADAGDAAQALLDAVMNSGGRAGQIGREAVDGRASASATKLNQVLDNTMGTPEGVLGLQKGYRDASRADLDRLYGQAYGTEIDWRSPAGGDLRTASSGLPSSVVNRTRDIRAMSTPLLGMPESAYPEFAPSVSQRPGPLAPGQDVDIFFSELEGLQNEVSKFYKRPFTQEIMQRGGVDPQSPAARELRNLGVTTRTAPGLFRRGGLKELDNFVASEFDNTLGLAADDTQNYLSRQSVIDAIVGENSGVPLRSSEQQIYAGELDRLEQMLPEFEAQRAAQAAMPSAPDVVGDPVPMRTVEDFDYIKRALDDIARAEKGTGAMGGQSSLGRLAEERARAIRNALVEISPTYGEALATAKGTIDQVQGVRTGRDALTRRMTREEVQLAMNGAAPETAPAIKAGVRAHIDELLANVRAVPSDPNIDARQAQQAFRELSSPASQEKLKAILGNDFDVVAKQIQETGAAVGLRASVAQNSKTAPRQAIKEMIDQISTPGALDALQRGQVKDSVQQIVRQITGTTDEMSAMQRQQVYEDLARALTEKRGRTAEVALQSLQRAMTSQQITVIEAEKLGNLVAAGLLSGGGPAVSKAAAAEANATVQ